MGPERAIPTVSDVAELRRDAEGSKDSDAVLRAQTAQPRKLQAARIVRCKSRERAVLFCNRASAGERLRTPRAAEYFVDPCQKHAVPRVARVIGKTGLFDRFLRARKRALVEPRRAQIDEKIHHFVHRAG